jgi:hypothetical protein
MTRPIPLIAPLLLLLSPLACAIAQTTTATSQSSSQPASQPSVRGYRGLWFTLGQRSQFGDKYSGGLGTYTANHVPIAIYSAKANKTFFVYGGTADLKKPQLQIMASCFDHATGKVPRPTIVHDKKGVNDPHDNGAIALDSDGYVWVFVSGRARARPGFVYRSTKPFSVEEFERLDEREMTYPQPRYIDGQGGQPAQAGQGFFYLFTKYTKGRELYWQTSSADGLRWEPEQKLVGFGGHYQVSGRGGAGGAGGAGGDTIGTAFMWHPNGNVDARTNLYYIQTRDLGHTWTSADRKWIKPPLTAPKNDALVVDYQSQKLLVYIHDLNFDADGRPAILYLTSKGHQPGEEQGERVWRISRFDGAGWRTRTVCTSDHNYDCGSLFIDGDRWSVVGPTLPGPQPNGTGGEIAIWSSADTGKTWAMQKQLTRDSKFNQTYVRRVVDGKPPFEFLWADGNPDALSESRLYFGSRTGDRYYELPFDMSADAATPIEHPSP